MSITSAINQYQGINAHFQSYAQNTYDGWSPFHSQYIADLTRAIGKSLRGTGYIVDPQRSLQIKRQDIETGTQFTQAPRPDVVIRRNPQAGSASIQVSGSVATPMIAQKNLDQAYFSPQEEPYEMHAIVIRRDETEVARIEILSPTNKRHGHERREYIEKRADTLRTGVVLVEVDYLHETPSLTIGLPDYLAGEPDARPYTISVIDPREQADLQKAVYGFGIDEPLMPIPIPLLGKDMVSVDFGGIYTETFNSLETFATSADYSRTPAGFETYTRADQFAIWARMLAIADARRAGINLDTLTTPLPAKFDEPALEQVSQLPYSRASLFIDENSFDAAWLVQHSLDGKAHILMAIYRKMDADNIVQIQQREILKGQLKAVENEYEIYSKRFENHLDLR